MLGDLQIPLCQVALLFSSVRDEVVDFDDAVYSRVKDRIQTIDDPHPTGLVSVALPHLNFLCHDAAKVFLSPDPAVDQAFGEQQWRHLNFLSNWEKK